MSKKSKRDKGVCESQTPSCILKQESSSTISQVSGFGSSETRREEIQSHGDVKDSSKIGAFGAIKSDTTDAVENAPDTASVTKDTSNITESVSDSKDKNESKKSVQEVFQNCISRFEDDADDDELPIDTKPVSNSTEESSQEKIERIIEIRRAKQSSFEEKPEKKTSTTAIETKKPVGTVDKINNVINEVNEHPIQSVAKGVGFIGGLIGNAVRRHSYNKLARTGCRVVCGDFVFVINNRELILVQYKGVANRVEIPAVVGGLTVKYIHPDFLYSSINPFNNYKVRSILNVFKTASSGVLTMDDENTFTSSVSEVILPNTLVAIPFKTFSGCKNLRKLVIPASVQTLHSDAFKNSSIEQLFFNGTIPKGFDINKFNGEIFVKQED